MVIDAAKTGAPRRRTRVCLGTSRCVIGTAAGCGQSGVHLLATNVDREWACRLNVVPGAMSTSTDALLRSASSEACRVQTYRIGNWPAKMIAFLAFAGLLAPTHAARETVTFDFGWRWRLGLHATPSPAGPPEPPTSGPGPNPKEAGTNFDDSSWAPVHLPHDGLIAQGASNISCPTGCSGRSFIPRHVMWYRKTFAFPAAWDSSISADSSAWIEFDGVFHAAIVYLNGEIVARNAEGYLGFHVQLDNTTGLLRPPGEKNVLAVFVDPDGGAGFSRLQRSGWWYEGGGIYRHARIVRSATVRIAQDGLVARSESMTGAAAVEAALLSVVATVENTNTADTPPGMRVAISLVQRSSGIVVGNATSTSLSVIPSKGTVDATAVVAVPSPELWGPHNPALYDVVATVVGTDGQTALDSVNVTHGFRTLTFSGADGTPSCTINDEPFKWRGFCDVSNSGRVPLLYW